MIPESAQKLIEDWRLGFVASADAEGRVNLSPKGTFVVLDARTIGFAEMRSPGTVANIAVRSEVEVNFVNVLTRKGVRLRGDAQCHIVGTERYVQLLPMFTANWPDLETMFNAIVTIDVTRCNPLASPAYEAGASEDALSTLWLGKIKELAQ